MRGIHRSRGWHRKPGPTFELVVLVVSLALVISQSLGMIAASALDSGSFNAWGWHSQATSTSKDAAAVTHHADNTSSQAHETTTTTARTDSSGTQALAPSGVDPEHVNFTLEGCRGEAGISFPATGPFICPDAQYTTGNLGKGWNELDRVPHRLTTDLGTQASATTTYDVAIVADYMDGGKPGYDRITVPVVNDAKSDDSCQVEASDEKIADPGLGGTDQSLYRILTITQDKGTTCVFDWNQRLALGSHLFPGSSLHSNLANKDLGTSGVGSREVSIPVKEILPQELNKTMTATQGVGNVWNIEKNYSPTNLTFGNSCDTQQASSKQITLTISWTKTVQSNGDIVIGTVITATNPAHRPIDIDVTDTIYVGAIGSTTVASPSDGQNPKTFSGTMAAESDLTFDHEIKVASGTGTLFSDKAEATYTDPVEPDVTIPGTTEATAQASVQTLTSDANNSVVITDSEDVSGNHLSFSVDSTSGASGTFGGGYTLGTKTANPITWTSAAQSGSGSVTFTKTVYVDEPSITSGTLSDTAQVNGDDDVVIDSAEASVDITVDAQVSLTIEKTIPDILKGQETQDFVFDITGPNDYTNQVTLHFAAGDTLKSTTLTGLEPGTYTVTEETASGWEPQPPQAVDISLPDCTGSASFSNSPVQASITIVKDAQPNDAQDFHFNGLGGESGFNLDDDADGTLPNQQTFGVDPGTYTVTENAVAGWNLSGVDCREANIDNVTNGVAITVGPGDQVTCTFTNVKPTTPPPPPPPTPAGIQVVKGGPAVAHVGDTITYTFAVTLTTSTPLTNITVVDPICSSAPALVSKTGGDQDTTLETGETWNFSCTHVVTATDPDPLPNTVTVTGTGPSGQVSDTDTHSVDIIHPAIKIVKTAKPTSIGPGETVTYTYTVTNTGDVTLFDVKVTDNKLGSICTIAQLDVGETKTCTADFTASSDFGGPLDNVGKAKGHDVTGFSVQDTDRASIDVVLGTTVTPVTPPSGVAFTGATGVIRLAGLALLLLLVGTGILFLTRRREDGTEA